MGHELNLTGRPLPTIAGELRHEVEQADQHWQSAVGHAIRAGELLTEAKAQVEHGQWLPWLEANFPGSERTAQNYMRLASNPQRVSDLPTIREAVAAITAPNPERQALVENARVRLEESEAEVRQLLANEAASLLSEEQREQLLCSLKADLSSGLDSAAGRA